MINKSSQPSAVSVSEMARRVGLSRQRFHQLIQQGIFPPPVYDVATKRPFYPAEIQEQCEDVRRQNVGVNGVTILFYSRRNSPVPARAKQRPVPVRKTPKSRPYADVLEAVRGLGLAKVKPDQVETAIAELYPAGVEGVERGEVIRSVFVSLVRKG